MFALKVLRPKGRASNTITQAIRSLLFFFQVLEVLNIDLELRLKDGRFLDVGEIDQIIRLSRLRQEILDVYLRGGLLSQDKNYPPARLESVRKIFSSSARLSEVEMETSSIRIGYICQYLRWFTARRVRQWNSLEAPIGELLAEVKLSLDTLKSQVPSKIGNRNRVGLREGLSVEVQNRLVEVIHPEAPENPWKSQHVRYRNQLLIHWLIGLSLRRGEALGVRLTDIDFRLNEVLIARRADAQDDPRTYQPLTKTADRILGLDQGLAQLTLDYINRYRRKNPGARSHEHLFVANGTGKPLSLVGVSKIFDQLRSKVPDLPSNLTAHVMRHTWNERFSELIDMKGVGPEEEKRWRNYQNGWSDGSKSAEIYTRRHARRESNDVSIKLQRSMLRKDEGSKEAPD
nr:site-specific integrase [Pseudomonas aeruginosa]